MPVRSFFVLLLLFACATSARINSLAVKCGYLFDSEKGEWKKDQTLLIQEGKIVSVNPSSLPNGTTVLDYSKSWVTPGLIDSHSHVFLEDPTMSKDFSQGLLSFLKSYSDIDRKKMGEMRLHSLLKAGFTSVRDLGNLGGVDVRSLTFGARLFSSGPGFSPQDGQLPPGTDRELLKKEYLLLSPRLPKDFAYDVLKLYADEEPNSTISDAKVLKNWVDWAHKRSIRVAAHAILKAGIDAAILAGVDTLEHGTQIDQSQIRKMKEKKIIFVPTNADYLFLLPQAKKYQGSWTTEVTKVTCGNIRKAHALQVPIAFGSDNYFSLEKEGLEFGVATREILLWYLDCGMKMSDILKASTYTAAASLGKEKEIGVLRVGAFADFVIYQQDPDKDPNTLRHPVSVYQNGIKTL